MNNVIKKRLHFETSHIAYNSSLIDVTYEGDRMSFYENKSLNIIDLSRRKMRRKTEDVIMEFDFSANKGKLELKENAVYLEFDIIESSFKYDNQNLHLNFKYNLGEEETFISIDIV